MYITSSFRCHIFIYFVPYQIKLTTWLLLIVTVSVAPTHAVPRRGPYDEKTKYGKPVAEIKYSSPSCRTHISSLTEFGGVGDGTTLNTDAFRSAIDHLSQFASNGGGMLYVPAGKWLTGPFNLTSYFTLFLHKDATILGTQVRRISLLF
jgi:polygalacturonase